ncbi:hypothetical protein [Paenibacillus sp. 7541]|uniref:hypothetical protein n=1 Tax=Paenibacillus sp. 7541 TaxID=2026236 RepID=UPI0011409CA7|nr:hypothetical protein [Paenibacillus sp. 7541]
MAGLLLRVGAALIRWLKRRVAAGRVGHGSSTAAILNFGVAGLRICGISIVVLRNFLLRNIGSSISVFGISKIRIEVLSIAVFSMRTRPDRFFVFG